MKKIGLATAVLLAMTGAHAYQVEVQGQSEHVETQGFDNTWTGDIQGTYYFKDVDASKGPLAEAAFLNKASSIALGYHYDKEVIQGKGTRPNFNNQTYGVKAEGYAPTPYMPVYGSLSYYHTDSDGKNYKSADDRGDRYALELGVMPTDNFLLAVGYTSVADQYSIDASKALNYGLLKANGESDAIGDDQDAVTARAKYVGNIDNTNMAIGFEVNSVFANGNAAYGASTDLYLTPKLSVGVSFADVSEFDASYGAVWGGNVNYFITPAFSVGANYVKADAKNGNTADSQSMGLTAKVRF